MSESTRPGDSAGVSVAAATGPLHPVLAPLAHVAAFAYGMGVRARNSLWDANIRKPTSVGIPVISVGNVSVGGTGKTPFVRWCVEALQASGHHPVIALRGYGARDGVSDEAEEFRAMLPGVPVAVGADRVASIARARAADPRVDCAVLDDAFQHRQIARDLDIVLVDAGRPAINGALLPAGWLREPACALRRASMVIVTRATCIDPILAAQIERLHGAPPAAWTRHAWTRVERFGAGGRDMPLAALDGAHLVVATALARPEAFVADVAAHGGRIAGDFRFRDHHAFSIQDVETIAARARAKGAAVICSGKDWAKLSRLVHEPKGVEWLVVRAGMSYLGGEAAVRAAISVAATAPECQ
jgi:tetraacyldisaccharide 4'-kinase